MGMASGEQCNLRPRGFALAQAVLIVGAMSRSPSLAAPKPAADSRRAMGGIPYCLNPHDMPMDPK